MVTKVESTEPSAAHANMPVLPYEDVIKSSNGKPNQMLFLNIEENELVHQHFLIVHGQVLEAKGNDDKIIVCHPSLPSLTFPAINGYFKAVVELEEGNNKLSFKYLQGNTPVSQGELTVRMSSFNDKPPLCLAIMLAKDSPETFDALPSAQGPGLNDLDAAVHKLRCCAYLWQAYAAEHMYRQGFGHRTFRLEEECVSDSSSQSEKQHVSAKVHIIRSEHTVAEMRDKHNAQQWCPETDEEKEKYCRNAMFNFAWEALWSSDIMGEMSRFACLTLDSHWDPMQELIVGHAGAGADSLNYGLGVMGSHTTHAWPSSASEIAACFMDSTKTDARYLGNDSGECDEHWKAANVGLAAFLHVAMMSMGVNGSTTSTGCCRGYKSYNHAFMAKDPESDKLIGMSDEIIGWEKADLLHLSQSPYFSLPSDQ